MKSIATSFQIMLLLIVLTLASGCQSMKNYAAASAPLFAGNFATPAAANSRQIKVITWNIKFGEKIETAIEELRTVEVLQNADILLLQEMDETGVEAIAKALGFNYVYYPASVHSHHHRNFGNAVLARWPISQPVILSLPYENPKNDQRRTATRALITIGSTPVLAYSTHTETIWLTYPKRLAQFETLIDDIGEQPSVVVVGGDFNTVADGDIVQLEDLFEIANLKRVSAGAGATVEKGGLPFTLDHIFARGVTLKKNGVYWDTQASDHAPLWAVLTLPQ